MNANVMGIFETSKAEVISRGVDDIISKPRAAPAPRQKQSPSSPSSFPVHTFPAKAQAFIESAVNAQGTPQDFLAAAMLWSAATASGNAVALEVKPGSRYTAILYMAIVGSPNSGKTPALRLALKPIHKADKAAFDDYMDRKAEYEAIKGMTKGERQEAVGEMPDKPVLEKILYSDTTIEATCAALFDRKRGIAIHRDELLAWILSFDRYSSGGESEFWLSSWAAEPVSVSRRTQEPIYVQNPYISVIGGIQPARIEQLAGGDRGVSGFLDRMLFVAPQGLEKPEWTLKGMDMGLVDSYHDAIDRILQLPCATDEHSTIKMTDEAREVLFSWFNRNNKPMCDSAPNELQAGMLGKFDVHCIRLTLALHLLRWGYGNTIAPGDIDRGTVEDGIVIAEYFRQQSIEVHKKMHGGTAVDRLPRNVQKLYEDLTEEFTTAEGVKVAAKNDLPERSFKRLLTNKDLFVQVGRGEYQKVL